MIDSIKHIIIGLLGAVQASFFGLAFTVTFYLIIIAAIFALGMFILWIIALIDCIKRKDEDFAIGGTNARLIWILLLLFIRNIVPLVYFFLIMYRKPSSAGKK